MAPYPSKNEQLAVTAHSKVWCTSPLSQEYVYESAILSIGRKSSIAGALGVTFGAMLATYRGHSIPFYSVSMGLNYAFVATTFFGVHSGIRHLRGKDDVLNYSASGFISGSFLTVPFVGLQKGIAAGILLGCIGTAGFYTSLKLDDYKRQYRKRHAVSPTSSSRDNKNNEDDKK